MVHMMSPQNDVPPSIYAWYILLYTYIYIYIDVRAVTKKTLSEVVQQYTRTSIDSVQFNIILQQNTDNPIQGSHGTIVALLCMCLRVEMLQGL